MSEPNRVPSGNHIFSCIDGHTCGNPVRLVIGVASLPLGMPIELEVTFEVE